VGAKIVNDEKAAPHAAVITHAMVERVGLMGLALVLWTALFAVALFRADTAFMESHFACFLWTWFSIGGARGLWFGYMQWRAASAERLAREASAQLRVVAPPPADVARGVPPIL
jgi:hypothetical protein